MGLRLNVDVYVDGFTPEQLAWFAQMPTWMSGAWGLAVWSGLLASVLLVSRMATGVFFLLSAICWAVLTVGLLWFRDPPVTEVTGDMGFYMLVASLVLALLFFIYTRWMRVRWRKIGKPAV